MDLCQYRSLMPMHGGRIYLDGDTFVAVCNLDIVHPVVVTPDINPVRAADVGSSVEYRGHQWTEGMSATRRADRIAML